VSVEGWAATVPLALSQAAQVGTGMGWLSTDVALSDVTVAGDAVIASARVQPQSTRGVTLRRVRLPCDGLEIGEPHGPAPISLRPASFQVAKNHFALRERPAAGAALDVDAEDASSLRFTLLAESGAFSEIEARWRDGSCVRGWVESALLEPRAESDETIRGSPPRLTCVPGSDLGAGIGATLVAGAAIAIAPGGGTWATLRQDAPAEVLITPGHDWVAVLALPGLSEAAACGRLRRAGRRRAAVRLAM
jgi:hypothetical protein